MNWYILIVPLLEMDDIFSFHVTFPAGPWHVFAELRKSLQRADVEQDIDLCLSPHLLSPNAPIQPIHSWMQRCTWTRLVIMMQYIIWYSHWYKLQCCLHWISPAPRFPQIAQSHSVNSWLRRPSSAAHESPEWPAANVRRVRPALSAANACRRYLGSRGTCSS